jgi:hypothetical protein
MSEIAMTEMLIFPIVMQMLNNKINRNITQGFEAKTHA